MGSSTMENPEFSFITQVPIIPFEESLLETGDRVKHNAHCFLFARTDRIHTGIDKQKDFQLPVRAIISMHMRFDGRLGFPGGRVDNPIAGLSLEVAKAEILLAVNRELEEEISFDTKTHPLTFENYVMTQRSVHHYKGPGSIGQEFEINYLHFFGKELPESYIPTLEEDAIKNVRGHEYGREVLGNIRVPLYTLTDDVRGFPSFLNNNFVGTSREQLLVAIVKFGILSLEEVEDALKKASAAK